MQNLDRLTVVTSHLATLWGSGGTQGSLQDQRALKDLSFKLLNFEFQVTVVEISFFKVLLLYCGDYPQQDYKQDFRQLYVATLQLSSSVDHFDLVKRSETFLKPSHLLKSIEYSPRYRFAGLVCTIATQSLHQEFHFHHQVLSFLLKGLTRHSQLVEIWIYSYWQDYQVWRQFNSLFLSYRISEIFIVVVHWHTLEFSLLYIWCCNFATIRSFWSL